MKVKVLISMMVLCLLIVPHAELFAQQDSDSLKTDKTNDIRKLIEMTGAARLGIDVMNKMVSSFKTSMPDVPAEYWNGVIEEAKPDTLIGLVVRIYDKYLSHEDIKKLIEFYESPVGKKLIEVQPLMTQELWEAGQQWGREIAQRVLEKLDKEGYK